MTASSPMTLYKISFLLFLSSFCLSYLFTPLIGKFAVRFGVLDAPSLKRKIHKMPTPLLGGLAIFLSFLISLGLLHLITSYYFSIGGSYYFIFYKRHLFWIKVGLYLICSLMILLIGVLDDLKSIDFRLKLLVQSLAALIMIFSGSRFDLFSGSFLDIFISFFWIVCLTNSFNLLDNMNGLTTGLAAIVFSFFIILSYLTNHYLMTLFLIIPAGCLLGFFPYNFPKAKIFLGDSGSLFVGFSSAIYSIWLFDHLATHTALHGSPLLSLLFVMSIPFCDTLTVMAIRFKNKKPFYIGDTNHLSHQLVRLGFSATNAVLILYASSVFIGMIGLFYILF